MKPTTMLYRNLLAMEAEELIRSQPIDGAVLMGGCDKTTPALIMGALSAGVPMIFFPAGPMLSGNYAGEKLGSGSDVWKFWDERRAGNISANEWLGIEGGIARSYGHCMTMGTASTMTAIAEAMGLILPGGSSIPAADAGHIRLASASGRRIVEMVWDDVTPDKIVTRAAIENAAKVAMATGCSTNAVIHLIAIARRAGVDLTLDDLDALGRTTPLIANIRPAGKTYLMEDFFYAGGLRALMANMAGHARPVLPHRVRAKASARPCRAPSSTMTTSSGRWTIRSITKARWRSCKGNLAPDGAVMKPAACDPKFHVHEGPALVFDSYPEMKAAIDDEDLDVTPDHVLVLRNAGPLGGPGMPEWGMLPIPKALIKQGHRDMLRISDARMSGTSYGACILHVAPEAFVGGPLALLRTGDIVRLDLPNRRLDMLVGDAELASAPQPWRQPEQRFGRGYGWMFARHVSQADKGCDFDYLSPAFGGRPASPIFSEPDYPASSVCPRWSAPARRRSARHMVS